MSKIIRSKREHGFTVIDNTGPLDSSLSWKAKGILAHILIRPDDWDLYVVELSKHAKDGRDSTTSGIQELIKAGYIVRKRMQRETGHFDGYDYVVHEKPQTLIDKAVNGKSVNGSTENGKSNTTKYLPKQSTEETKVDHFQKVPNLKKLIGAKQYDSLNEIADDELILIRLRSLVKDGRFNILCEWLEHRKELRRLATGRAIKKLLKTFESYTKEELKEGVDKGIESGHVGLYPKKAAKKTPFQKTSESEPVLEFDPNLFDLKDKIKKID